MTVATAPVSIPRTTTSYVRARARREQTLASAASGDRSDRFPVRVRYDVVLKESVLGAVSRAPRRRANVFLGAVSGAPRW